MQGTERNERHMERIGKDMKSVQENGKAARPFKNNIHDKLRNEHTCSAWAGCWRHF